VWWAALAFGLLAAPALPPTHATTVPKPTQSACPGRFDPKASTARFKVDVRLPIRAEGRFPDVHGAFHRLDDGQCQVQVELDASAVVYDGPEWLAKLTRSPAFLDADAHPQVRFVSAPFPLQQLNGGGPLRGRLTLRGRERPVEFRLAPAACVDAGYGCPLHVSGEVSRRDFGMQAYRFTVKDAVRFEFTILLEPPP
jgi:polyisoprenoid-binding protein YceI